MTTWIIKPRDPLIVRDGRPFGPDPGARARSLPFPFPSTTTGGVRTRAGLENGIFNKEKIEAVKEICVRGPLLVSLDDNDEIETWFFPAPADALLLPVKSEAKGAARPVDCRRLVPLQLPTGAVSNIPMKPDQGEPLALVGLPQSEAGKPEPEPPSFWKRDRFEQWLTSPPDRQQLTVGELGHEGPKPEQRMHVRIDPDTLTGVEGFLFQTSGLEFTQSSDEGLGQRLALALETEAETLDEGLAPLGGERRLMRWRKSGLPWPQRPASLKSEIAHAKTPACRLLLLTPAYFEGGYRPGWLLEPRYGVTPKLEAIALPRPQIVSGWDFTLKRGANPGAPKPTRRLAPAGSVYFLKLEGEAADIEQWVEKMWMACVSDGEQNRWDGFGLAALGVWSGQPEAMKATVKEAS